MTGTERGRGGASSFLANHGYFVSTLNDDENDDDYWTEEGREGHRHTQTIWSPEIQERNISRRVGFENQPHQFTFNSYHTKCTAPASQHSNIVYLSPFQLKKSRACSEASKYSLQRSHELLMGRSIHEADPEESSESSSVQYPSCQKNVNVIDIRPQNYVMEPTREVLVTSRVTANPANLEHAHAITSAANNSTRNVEDAIGDDYPDPIDMELYYNHPVQNNQTYRHLTSHRMGSELMICDWKDETTQADRDAYNICSPMTQPQRECKDLTMDPAVYRFRKTEYAQRDAITSQKQKQLSRQFKSFRSSQERGLHGSKNHSTSVNSPMLRILDPVKNCGTISEKGCLSRVSEDAHDYLQRFDNSNADQFTCHKKKSKMQDTVRVSATMRHKHIRYSHPTQGYSKRQHQEARNDKGDTRIRCEQVPSVITGPGVQKCREDIWTLANTETYIHDGSLQAPGFANQGAHRDQRNAFWTSQSPVESKAITSNASDYITAPERGNSTATEVSNSKIVKHGAPSTQSAKEQLLSAINRARRVRQNNTQSNASESIANAWDEEGKFLDAESPHSKCLRERQLQTLNVIDYKTPEADGRTTYRLTNRMEGTHRPGVDETCDRKGMTSKIAVSSDVIASENSRTNVHACKRKDGAIPNSLPEKDNTNQTESTNQTEHICVPSGLVEKESVGNGKLTSPSTVTEVQRLQVSIYSRSQQVEETNVEEQEQSKKSGLFVESKSREVIQVDVKGPEQYTELALQSNRLLKLLRDLQVQSPAPGNSYENTSIISTKTEGMTDAAPQYGYLAQYLKMQNIGARGARRILATRR